MKFLSLKYKLLLFCILLSVVLTVILSAFEIKRDISKYDRDLVKDLDHFEQLHREYLSGQVWAMEYGTLKAFSEDEVGDIWIDYLKITDTRGFTIAQAGKPLTPNARVRHFDLTYSHNDENVIIGKVVVGGNIPTYGEWLQGRWRDILLVNGLLVTIIFFFSYLTFYRQVLARLTALKELTEKDTLENVEEPDFTGKVKRGTPDEITLLADALNERSRRVRNEFRKREEAEKELRSSQQTLRAVLDGIDASVYVADLQTNEIMFMNKYMIESFGDLIGKKCYRALRNEDAVCPICTNDKLIDDDGQPTGVSVWQDQNPVTQKYYVNYDRAIEWTDGRLVKLQVATDITDLKQMEEQLRQAQKMESVGRLAGGVAHDFNNMLSIILGNKELIEGELSQDSPLNEYVQEIGKAANRSADLTRQLLAFARKQTVKPEVIDLNETIAGMLKMLTRLIGEDVKLEWRLDPKLWPVIIDPTQIDQIMVNLLVNSRDAIEGVGKILIETENSYLNGDHPLITKEGDFGDYIKISIKDNGKGMDQVTLENLFEPFFTTKELGKGTGLGLATVYGIVKQNDGLIDVFSRPGEGARFDIYLPRHDGAEEQRQDDSGNNDGVSAGKETVLVVEDELAILNMIKAMLSHLGYTVLAAAHPDEALKVVDEYEGKIHLVLSDVIMPEMNGSDLARKLREVQPDLNCLFMSGYTADVIGPHGVLDSSVEFIQKPFKMADMAEKIRQILSQDNVN